MHLRFDNRVAIVTGAGQGLGRAYALELARRGAKVIVNDLQPNIGGNGGGRSLAHDVADEIVAAGGQAVANTDTVEEGQQLIACALDTFGGIDILLNNAGVLRNNSFAKMSEDDWDLIYRVHLLGAMRVTKAAWPIMRNGRFGRILMTTSNAAFYGSLGAANYAMAKAGTIAFAKTLALEGAPRNIHVNAIAPMAGSRLTATIWPRKVIDAFTPELVAPAIAWLCHESCSVSGRVFEVGGGWVSELRWEQSEGVQLKSDLSAEDIQARWGEITKFGETSRGERALDYIERIAITTGERVTL